ncbi:NAD(P)-binding domain-containing protein [Paenibacillus sp. NPDC057934]|uniref:NAD(P)-binding domain-containing protein n=1 Tax=Paenibacillus sp. NPDC057934 TaxID=3346282 RepID=UPI0036DA4B09
MNSEIKVGIVGVGKLGKVLAAKLSTTCSLYVCDLNEEAAQAISSAFRCNWDQIDKVAAKCDYLFLALPPTIIHGFCTQYASCFKSGSTVLNLATSVDSRGLKDSINRDDLHVLGLKPVCQSTALEQGQRTIFVTSAEQKILSDELAMLISPLGTIQRGHELTVKEINEAATRRALELIINLKSELMEQDVKEDLIEAAVRSVAVGTLLDYPYQEVNGYIANLLSKYDLQLK